MDSCQICTQSVPPFYTPLYANLGKSYSFLFLQKHACNSKKTFLGGSVADPDPTDPYVLGLPDQDPSIFCTDPDPSINKQKKSKENLDFYYFVTSFCLCIYETDVNVPSKSNKNKTTVYADSDPKYNLCNSRVSEIHLHCPEARERYGYTVVQVS